jgi:Tfp pilus assembly protein PilV
VGALVVFSMGVLMVASMTSSLSQRFRDSSMRTAVAIVGQQRLDSLAILDYDSLSVGTTTNTIPVLNEVYGYTIRVTQENVVTREVQVELDPSDGSGPRFDGIVYVGRSW